MYCFGILINISMTCRIEKDITLQIIHIFVFFVDMHRYSIYLFFMYTKESENFRGSLNFFLLNSNAFLTFYKSVVTPNLVFTSYKYNISMSGFLEPTFRKLKHEFRMIFIAIL